MTNSYYTMCPGVPQGDTTTYIFNKLGILIVVEETL